MWTKILFYFTHSYQSFEFKKIFETLKEIEKHIYFQDFSLEEDYFSQTFYLFANFVINLPIFQIIFNVFRTFAFIVLYGCLAHQILDPAGLSEMLHLSSWVFDNKETVACRSFQRQSQGLFILRPHHVNGPHDRILQGWFMLPSVHFAPSWSLF